MECGKASHDHARGQSTSSAKETQALPADVNLLVVCVQGDPRQAGRVEPGRPVVFLLRCLGPEDEVGGKLCSPGKVVVPVVLQAGRRSIHQKKW
jgi:hypothetical protein